MKQYVKIFGWAGFICALLIALLLGCEPLVRMVAGWDIPEVLGIAAYTTLLVVGTFLLWTCRVHREERLKSIGANALWVSAAVLAWSMWVAYVLSVALFSFAEQPKALFNLGSQQVYFMWRDRGADNLADLFFLGLAVWLSLNYKGKWAVALKGVLAVAFLRELLRALAVLIAFWIGADRLSLLASFEFATMSLHELVGMTALVLSELLICSVFTGLALHRKKMAEKKCGLVIGVAIGVVLVAVVLQFAERWSQPLTAFNSHYTWWIYGGAIVLGLLCSGCVGIAVFAKFCESRESVG